MFFGVSVPLEFEPGQQKIEHAVHDRIFTWATRLILAPRGASRDSGSFYSGNGYKHICSMCGSLSSARYMLLSGRRKRTAFERSFANESCSTPKWTHKCSKRNGYSEFDDVVESDKRHTNCKAVLSDWKFISIQVTRWWLRLRGLRGLWVLAV